MTRHEEIEKKFDKDLKEILHTACGNRWAILERAAQDDKVSKGMLFFLVGMAYPDLRGPH